MKRIEELLERMMIHNQGDPKRIHHFLKVYELARMIGLGEGLDGERQEILEAAAAVHDIGIRPSEEKFGRCDGPLQEQEGPAPAEAMLTQLGYDKKTIRRVCFLVGHHHTYSAIDGPDFQALVEADFLVNLYEDGTGAREIRAVYDRIFRTGTGRRLCREMYGLETGT